MRRRRIVGRPWPLAARTIAVGIGIGVAFGVGRDGRAQTVVLPVPLPPSSTSGSEGATGPILPPAPGPIPGPADEGLPVGAADALLPQGLPINLATAMQLAGVQPLDIAAATKQVEQAVALQLQARALKIPNLNGGVDYQRHDGVQQNIFNGSDFQKGRNNLFVGGAPTLSVGTADAIFAPLAARRVVSARRADLQAARNDTLFSVAQAYFDLQAARGRLLGLATSMDRADRLVNLATNLAPSLIAPLEINRARAELQSLRQTRQVAIRDWQVASARLAEILLLDPAALLEPIEPPFLQIDFFKVDQTPEELVPVALNYRPEIASRRELVAAAHQLLQQEKTRPFLPNVILLSPATGTGLIGAGYNGAGANGSLNTAGSRLDVEVAAIWQLQNAGVGNVGRIRQRKAEQDLASIDLTRIVYRVRSEVTQASARLQAARVRVVETGEGVRQAVESADKNFIGLRQTTRPAGELLRLVVRPQEVVAAIIALESAYEQFSYAVAEFNAAQFEVYRALGRPAQWVTCPTPNPNAPPAPAPPTPRVR